MFRIQYQITTIMSLLDQISSLCGSNTQQNGQRLSSFFDFDATTSPKRSVSVTPSKTIKLFNEDELHYGVNSAKKKAPQTQFKEMNVADKKNQMYKQLTNLSFMMNNKVRKINYAFFVKLEKYTQQIKKNNQKAQEIRKAALEKLADSVAILTTKYSDQYLRGNSEALMTESFETIKYHALCRHSIQQICKYGVKSNFSRFWTNLKKINTQVIKLDIFCNTVCDIIQRRILYGQNQIKRHSQEIKSNLKDQEAERALKQRQSLQIEQLSQRQQKPKIVSIRQVNTLNRKQSMFIEQIAIPKDIRISERPQWTSQQGGKSIQVMSVEQLIQVDWSYSESQNTPLQLHPLKSHEEQTSLPDCIDNGHLLMNQIRNNLGLQSQLTSMTNSLMGSFLGTHQNSTASLASSIVTAENLAAQVQMAFGQNDTNGESSHTTQAVTMRKSLKKDSIIRQIKKPRSSLVITKRPQSTTSDYQKPEAKKVSAKRKTQATLDKQSLKKILSDLNNRYGVANETQSGTKKNTPAKNQESNMQKKKCVTSSNKVSASASLNSSAVKVRSSRKKEDERNSIGSKHLKINFKKEGQAKKTKESIARKSYETKNSYELDSSFNSIRLKYGNNTKVASSKQDKIRNTIDQIRCFPLDAHNDRSVIVTAENRNMKKKRDSLNITLNSRDKTFSLDEGLSSNPLSIRREQQYRLLQHDISLLENAETVVAQKKRPPQAEEGNLKFSEFLQRQNENTDMQQQQKLLLNESGDSYEIRSKRGQHHPSSDDSAVEQYISCIPSDQFLPHDMKNFDNQEVEVELVSVKRQAETIKPKSKPSYLCSRQSKVMNCSKSSVRDGDSVKKSLQKKKSSFEKNKQSWDQMFSKQKSKFLKADSGKKSQKKSSVNSSVIEEIKAKIEKCILGTKDLNTNQFAGSQPSIKPKNTQHRQRSSIITLKPYLMK